jgi:hypothetical protein
LWFAAAHPLPFEHWPVLCQNGCLRIVFLLLIFGGLIAYGKMRNPRGQAAAGVVLLALVWMDLATEAPRQNPTVEASVFQPGLLTQPMNPARLDPAPKLGEARAFLTRQSHALFYGSMLTNADRDYLGRRCALLGDCNILDDIPVADGFYSLYVRQQRGLFMQFFSAPTNSFPEGLADFLGISQMSDPQKTLAWQFRPSHLPFYSVGAKPEFVELSNTPALLFSQNFNPHKTVYLPLDAQDKVHLTNAVQGAVRAAQFTPQRVELETEAGEPTLLVLSQTYYHPWRAYVNGQPEPVWRANYAFQAVEIPGGRSTVELVYQDQFFYWGLLIAGFTLLGCLIGLAMRAKGPENL